MRKMCFGLCGLLLSAAWCGLDWSSATQLDAGELSVVHGGAGTPCQMANYANSGCTTCTSNGNGGSTKCLTVVQGYICGAYTNPAYHYRAVCDIRDTLCGGNAEYYLRSANCTGTFLTLTCGRGYDNDDVAGGQVVTCPAPPVVP